MRDADPVSLSAADAARLGRTDRHVRRDDVARYNYPPGEGPPFPGAGDPPTRLLKVTAGIPSQSTDPSAVPDPETGPGLYKCTAFRLAYDPYADAKTTWATDPDALESWLAATPGQSYAVGDLVVAVCVDSHEGRPVFAAITASTNADGFDPCKLPPKVVTAVCCVDGELWVATSDMAAARAGCPTPKTVYDYTGGQWVLNPDRSDPVGPGWELGPVPTGAPSGVGDYRRSVDQVPDGTAKCGGATLVSVPPASPPPPTSPPASPPPPVPPSPPASPPVTEQ